MQIIFLLSKFAEMIEYHKGAESRRMFKDQLQLQLQMHNSINLDETFLCLLIETKLFKNNSNANKWLHEDLVFSTELII